MPDSSARQFGCMAEEALDREFFSWPRLRCAMHRHAAVCSGERGRLIEATLNKKALLPGGKRAFTQGDNLQQA